MHWSMIEVICKIKLWHICNINCDPELLDQFKLCFAIELTVGFIRTRLECKVKKFSVQMDEKAFFLFAILVKKTCTHCQYSRDQAGKYKLQSVLCLLSYGSSVSPNYRWTLDFKINTTDSLTMCAMFVLGLSIVLEV